MAKWADYAITAVHYDSNHDRIIEVEIMKDAGEALEAPTKMLREKVVKEIQDGTTFVTAFRKDDNYYKGDAVEIYHVNGKNYIRTVGNNKEKDNLENLPEY